MPLLKSFLILSDLVHSKFPTSSLQGAFGGTRARKPRPKLGKTQKSASKKAKSRNCFSEQNLQFSAVVFDYFQHFRFLQRLSAPYCKHSKAVSSISVVYMDCMDSKTGKNRNLE